MPRVQLALRVADLEASIAFYSRLFGAEPAKRRPGYANFAIMPSPCSSSSCSKAPQATPPGWTTWASRWRRASR